MELWLVIVLIILSPIIFIAGIFGLIIAILFVYLILYILYCVGYVIYWVAKWIMSELKTIKIRKDKNYE